MLTPLRGWYGAPPAPSARKYGQQVPLFPV